MKFLRKAVCYETKVILPQIPFLSDEKPESSVRRASISNNRHRSPHGPFRDRMDPLWAIRSVLRMPRSEDSGA